MSKTTNKPINLEYNFSFILDRLAIIERSINLLENNLIDDKKFIIKELKELNNSNKPIVNNETKEINNDLELILIEIKSINNQLDIYNAKEEENIKNEQILNEFILNTNKNIIDLQNKISSLIVNQKENHNHLVNLITKRESTIDKILKNTNYPNYLIFYVLIFLTLLAIYFSFFN